MKDCHLPFKMRGRKRLETNDLIIYFVSIAGNLRYDNEKKCVILNLVWLL